MATVALLAWSESAAGLDAGSRLVIEQHGGRIGMVAGLAFFTGGADALEAAVRWQQRNQSAPTTALAIAIAELDRAADASESRAVVELRQLAESGRPGEILATEIVRLLLPEPSSGRWAARSADNHGRVPAGYELHWRRSPEQEHLTVVVAEDAAIIRAGIVSLLRDGGMNVVGEAADYDAIMAVGRATRPQLLITDVRLPPGQSDEGLRAAALLRAEQPSLSVLVLSQFVQASAAADLLTGQTSGLGYLLKERVADLDEFLDAARTVARGGTVIDELITAELLGRRMTGDRFEALADRERAVLGLMAQGLSNAAIADRLSLSARTVESHVRSIMTKLDLWEDPAGNRRVQAVIQWLNQA